jgi:hypothetical protein
MSVPPRTRYFFSKFNIAIGGLLRVRATIAAGRPMPEDGRVQLWEPNRVHSATWGGTCPIMSVRPA